MAQVYIGLGSNLENPRVQLKSAVKGLAALPGSRIVADSGVFRSRPMVLAGDTEMQPDYLNQVIKLETDLSPHELLDQLQAIELSQGRQRSRTWGPRTLDLDILMYDDLQLQDERLSIPHPGMAKRDFVLYPLSVIDEHLLIPGMGPLSALLAELPESDIEQLGFIDE